VNRDEKPKPKQFFYTSSALLLALSISLVYASVFVYYPASVSVQGVRPPVVFQAVPGVPATISPWGTYASVSLSPPLIVKNANFSGTLNPWIYSSTISQYSWSSVPVPPQEAPDGYVASFSEADTRDRDTGYGEIYQDISIPSVAGARSYTITIYIRYRIYYINRGSIYIIYGLYNPATGSWIPGCSKQTPTYTTTTNWIPDSFSCSVAPGSYRLRAYIYINRVRSFTVYIDYLYVSVYSFSGAVLNVFNQDSQPYYAKLALDSVAGSNIQNLYCEVSLGNSQSIQIRGGQTIVGETSEVVLPSSNSPSNPIPINVNCLTTSSGIYSLNLTLRYCTLPGDGGACVFYPLTITLRAD